MNSPKLTNILLIALVVINGLFLARWVGSAMHHRHINRMAMYNEFRGGRHDSFSFHHRFGARRSYRCCGSFRNRHNSRWN
jgi:hypothetical protein